MTVRIDVDTQAKSLKRRLNRDSASPAAHAGLQPIRRRVRALLRGGEEGSSLIEIALTMPMLLMVITAICTFAIGFNNKLALTSGVGAGVQNLQLIRSTSTDPCKDTLTAIQNASPTLTSGSITLSFTMNGTPVSGNTCSGDQTYLVQGAPVTVTAKYPCSLAIYATKFTTACQLSSTATVYEY